MSVAAAYLGVILIWSTTPLAIKWSSEGAGYLFGVGARMLLGLVICLVIVAMFRMRLQWNKQAVYAYLAASLAAFGSMMIVYWGAQYITSGLLSVLFGITPLMTGIMAAWLLREYSLSTAKLTGIFIGLIGLVVIFHSDIIVGEDTVLGVIAILVATTLHSLSTVLIKKLGNNMPGMVLNTGSLMITSTLFVAAWFISDTPLPEEIPIKAGASIVYLGIFGSVIGFTLYYYALQHLDANRIGLIPLITPVSALLLGNVFNHEPVTMSLGSGAFLILLGLGVHHWGDLFRKRIKARVRKPSVM